MKSAAGHLARLVLCVALVCAGVAIGAWFFRAPSAPPPAVKGELWTCSMHPQVIRDAPGVCPICFMKLVPVRKGGDAPGQITIDPVLTQNMGLRTAPVEEGPLTMAVRTLGAFREAEPLRREVALRVSGWIEKLHAATEGVRVKKGDPLFDLYSPELLVAQNELLAARRALKRLPEKADALLRADAESLLESSRERLRLLDVPSDTIDAILAAGVAQPTITFRSPADGFVLEKDVVQGAAVEASKMLFRIVDLSTLWLDAQIYEPQLALIAVGRRATARVASLPGRDFAGEVVFVSPRIDPQTRTAVARLAFPNGDLSLKPGLYASVELSIPVAEKTILVPREAVIDTGSRQVAFVAKGRGHFEARNVRMGAENGAGAVQILGGLVPGETVVVSGQFLLDAESRVREAIRKLSPPATEPGFEAVVRAYLPLADSLARDKPVEPPAVDTLIEEAKRANAPEVAKEVEHLCCVPIKEQRERFKKVSEALIALKPAGYVIRCPMADARWLQTSDRIQNPYMGTSMPQCGTIEARK
ncbi:MAG TPA: efflux RND transporter periplasmic adaptor subunit [Planctomycetota bacterium]